MESLRHPPILKLTYSQLIDYVYLISITGLREIEGDDEMVFEWGFEF